MEGTFRPSRLTAWIFSSEWPVGDALMEELKGAVERGLLGWVLIPVTGVSSEHLQSEADAFSMEMQDP